MKMLITLMLLVASCTSPEEATIEAGGKDGRRAMFVCKNAPKSVCVEVRRVLEVWQ